MRRKVLWTGACLLLSAIALGAGCWQARSDERPADISVPAPASGPKLLDAENRAPNEIATSVKLVSSSIIVMRENVSGVDPALADEAGMGMGENKRTVVVQRFAPGNLAEVSWKLDFSKQATGGKSGVEANQLTGSVTDARLLDAYKLYPPAFWPQSQTGAFNSGILWLSQDVYENLNKGKLSSFDLGLTDPDYMRTLHLKAGSKLTAAVARLKHLGDDTIEKGHLDVYLAKTSPDAVEWQLTVNGKLTKVEAFKASSWFGEFLVMKNPYYPLVLKVKTSDAVRAIFGTLFDYEVTELKDVEE